MSSRLSTLFLLVLAIAGGGRQRRPRRRPPSYRERAILALTNACRNAIPRNTGGLARRREDPPAEELSARRALSWTLPLNRSARAHSIDMARGRNASSTTRATASGGLWDRIGGYYKGATSMAENIAAGYRTPLAAVKRLDCSRAAPDHSKGDGHRRNIMAAKFVEVGCGSIRAAR
jgi:hypothetical protein